MRPIKARTQSTRRSLARKVSVMPQWARSPPPLDFGSSLRPRKIIICHIFHPVLIFVLKPIYCASLIAIVSFLVMQMGAICSGALETKEQPQLTFPVRSESQMRPVDDVLSYVAARDPKKIALLVRSLLLGWRFIPDLISLIDSFFVSVEHTWHPIALPPTITLKTVTMDGDGSTLYSKGVISGMYQFVSLHSVLTGPRRWRIQIEFPKGPRIACQYCENETSHDIVSTKKSVGWELVRPYGRWNK